MRTIKEVYLDGVEIPDGYVGVGYRPVKAGDLYLTGGGSNVLTCQANDSSRWRIILMDLSELKITVGADLVYDTGFMIPDDYEFVRFGVPEVGEYYIGHKTGWVMVCDKANNGLGIVVLPKMVTYTITVPSDRQMRCYDQNSKYYDMEKVS